VALSRYLKQDWIAAAATALMFLGALILPSTSLGLLPIGTGVSAMFFVIAKAVRKSR
jgi:hypothetical protein